MVTVGIIGCGKIAQTRHIPEYMDRDDVRIAGVFDNNKERANEIAAKIGCKAYETIDELLADQQIDAVSICVANVAHAEVSIKAFEAGKHVLCEKPMATTIEECEAMVASAKKNGCYLMIDQNQRFTPSHTKAKELLFEGRIGRVITFRTTFGHAGPEKWSIEPGTSSWFFNKNFASMGAMADLGVHKTDLIQYLLESKVVETTAVVGTYDKKDADGNPIGVDDNAICIYRMDNGAVGTMVASWTFYGQEDNSTILYGTKGIMRIYDDKYSSIRIISEDGSEENLVLDSIQTNDNQTKSGVIDAFVDSLIAKHDPPVDGKSVLSAMRAVFASAKSSELKRSVKVEQKVI